MLKRSESPDSSGSNQIADPLGSPNPDFPGEIRVSSIKDQELSIRHLPHLLSCPACQPSTHLLCKTNPIPSSPKPTQPLMPHGFTPIFRPAPPEKTNPTTEGSPEHSRRIKPNLSRRSPERSRRSARGGPDSPKARPRPSSVISRPSSVFCPPPFTSSASRYGSFSALPGRPSLFSLRRNLFGAECASIDLHIPDTPLHLIRPAGPGPVLTHKNIPPPHAARFGAQATEPTSLPSW